MLPVSSASAEEPREVLPTPVLESALCVALDSLGVPGFVVTPRGRVILANACGDQWLQAKPTEVRTQLVEALRPRRTTIPVNFVVRPILVDGSGPYYLAIAHSSVCDAKRRARLAQDRWALTPRQTEVVELLAQGRSNRAISMELGCAEGTVELHVSAVLEKAGAESRVEVVARFWRELGG